VITVVATGTLATQLTANASTLNFKYQPALHRRRCDGCVRTAR
jgi:hypothetical protein